MISKNELKYFSSLTQKKFRNSENKFIVEGLKSVEEGLKSKFVCEVVLVTFTFEEENKELIATLKKKAEVKRIHNNELPRLTDTKTPQGILGVFKKAEPKPFKPKNSGISVFLDNINDPGNLGTIIRICDWFGIKDILLSPNSVDIYNSKTLRATMGSVFHLNFFPDFTYLDLEGLKRNGYKIAASDLTGQNLFELEPERNTILVFSNEASGPSNEILSCADYFINIPKYGKAESLNVAAASAVIISKFISSLK